MNFKLLFPFRDLAAKYKNRPRPVMSELYPESVITIKARIKLKGYNKNELLFIDVRVFILFKFTVRLQLTRVLIVNLDKMKLECGVLFYY